MVLLRNYGYVVSSLYMLGTYIKFPKLPPKYYMKGTYACPAGAEGGGWGAMNSEKSGKPGCSFKNIRKYPMAFLTIWKLFMSFLLEFCLSGL